jgi:hypothetical protein
MAWAEEEKLKVWKAKLASPTDRPHDTSNQPDQNQ